MGVNEVRRKNLSEIIVKQSVRKVKTHWKIFMKISLLAMMLSMSMMLKKAW